TISVKHVQASDVRPLPVLEMTLNHLLSLLSSSRHPFEVVHDFVFDRTRSIRQDLGMHNIVNHKAVHMYEEMIKFHVISHHKLQSCGNSPDISSIQYLNQEQLAKALVSLYDMSDRTRKFESRFLDEAEYRSLYVLLHLGFSSQQIVNVLRRVTLFVVLPATFAYHKSERNMFCTKPVEVILTLNNLSLLQSKKQCNEVFLRTFRWGNYKHFFCTIAAKASLLQYCIIASYVNEFDSILRHFFWLLAHIAPSCCIVLNVLGFKVHAPGVSIIYHGGYYKLNPYPVGHLSNLLMLTESDMESFCHACGLQIHTGDAGNRTTML
ncbi:SAC3/GANP/THP3, conserved domain, partial [Dillenia turbinata]